MLQSIGLKFFRNHFDFSQSFSHPMIVIIGDNAAGKTSLLEGIFVAATGSGFRSGDNALVNRESSEASVRLETINGVRLVKLYSTNENKIDKILTVDNELVRSFSKFSAELPVVLFEPEELRMLTGPPDLRRSWLDNLLSRINPNYPGLLKNYSRALKQRNRLLKTGIQTEDQYFVWELKLSEYGSSIVEARKKLFDELNSELTNLYQKISSGNEALVAEYKLPSGSYAAWLASTLRLRREHDQRLGFTTCGPHRDDFVIVRNGQPLQETGSRGEVRSAVLALKLFEVYKVEKASQIKPVLLLDDVFSELDRARRKSLLDSLDSYQTLITATEIDEEIVTERKPQIIKL